MFTNSMYAQKLFACGIFPPFTISFFVMGLIISNIFESINNGGLHGSVVNSGNFFNIRYTTM